jgi:pantothenate kinase
VSRSGAFAAAIQRAEMLVQRGGRILGIAGAPGAGKSTLVSELLDHFGRGAAVLPMDGFHLANAELARLGLADRKGAPETFDADGYVAALSRVRARCADVLVPAFDRSIEESLAGALRIAVDVPLVITEGNYLLLQVRPWDQVRELCDETWMVSVEAAVRRERLVARHVRFGRSPTEAAEWVARSDEANAALIARASAAADWVFEESARKLTDW